MGSVFRKTATKPLPRDADIIERGGRRFAKWTDQRGKLRTSPVTVPKKGPYAGQQRIVVTPRTFTAKYRDGEGIVREVATGCRDETAAKSVLTGLERRGEIVRAKILTPAEDAMIDHLETPLEELFGLFNARRTKKARNGVSTVRQENSLRRLKRLVKDLGLRKLVDLRAEADEALNHWMTTQLAEGMSPGNCNEYRMELVVFGNWCVATKRLSENPFSKVIKLDAVGSPNRKRRAMTEPELRRLLEVTRRRPLAEYGRLSVPKLAEHRNGKRDTWTAVPLAFDALDEAEIRARQRLQNNPSAIDHLVRLGRERALIYKTLVLTGLRRGELASLTVGQLHLDAPQPCIELAAADEKNREGSLIAIRADLATDLGRWVAELGKRSGSHTDKQGQPACLPMKTVAPASGVLSLDTPLFHVPVALVKVLDRDLKVAGIPKADDRGRTLDVHALRHSFGTLLSKGNVAPRTAQELMRHSTIDLTMNVYTDPRLLDTCGALDSLPDLPLDGEPRPSREAARATGTEDHRPRKFAPGFAPTSDNPGKLVSTPVKVADSTMKTRAMDVVDVSRSPDKRKRPLSTADSGRHLVERKGVEPSTSALRTQRSPN